MSAIGLRRELLERDYAYLAARAGFLLAAPTPTSTPSSGGDIMGRLTSCSPAEFAAFRLWFEG